MVIEKKNELVKKLESFGMDCDVQDFPDSKFKPGLSLFGFDEKQLEKVVEIINLKEDVKMLNLYHSDVCKDFSSLANLKYIDGITIQGCESFDFSVIKDLELSVLYVCNIDNFSGLETLKGKSFLNINFKGINFSESDKAIIDTIKVKIAC